MSNVYLLLNRLKIFKKNIHGQISLKIYIEICERGIVQRLENIGMN